MTTFWRLAILAACFAVVAYNDGHARPMRFAPHYIAVLLEPSAEPATLAECRRNLPAHGNPVAAISYQQRTNEPYYYRTCLYEKAAVTGETS